jgi:hypothetical protein
MNTARDDDWLKGNTIKMILKAKALNENTNKAP